MHFFKLCLLQEAGSNQKLHASFLLGELNESDNILSQTFQFDRYDSGATKGNEFSPLSPSCDDVLVPVLFDSISDNLVLPSESSKFLINVPNF